MAALPVHIITGFLGAGKTTLINALLRDPALGRALALVNEFGEIGLDHWLYEKIADETLLLSSGCLCCGLRGDLVDALLGRLAERDRGRLPPFERIIIETSGLADPGPILHALIVEPTLARRLRLANVIAVVDAVNAAATLETYPEARRQLALADFVVATKRDLVADAGPTLERIRAVNPLARAIERGEIVAALDDPPVSAFAERASPRSAHGGDVRAHAFTHGEPLDEAALLRFLARLTALLGPKLLRIKGLAALRRQPERPLLIQGAQALLHPPERLAAWPDADRRTRLVIIVDGPTPRALEDLWRALTGALDLDRPDLADNPLDPRPGGLLG